MSKTSQQSARLPKTWFRMKIFVHAKRRKKESESESHRKQLESFKIIAFKERKIDFNLDEGEKMEKETNNVLIYHAATTHVCNVQCSNTSERMTPRRSHLLDNFDFACLFCVRWQLNLNNLQNHARAQRTHTHSHDEYVLIANSRYEKLKKSNTSRRRWFINLNNFYFEWILKWWMDILLFALV